MANIKSEVEQATAWRNKNNQYSQKASGRTLELVDLTIADSKNKSRLKAPPICRVCYTYLLQV